MSQEVPNLFPQPIKNVLVTGGAGFIGSTLVKRLLSDKNLKVFNLDKLGYASNLKCIDNFLNNNIFAKENYQFFKADLNNYTETLEIINFVKPDLIFNLAAESHVDRSIQTPRVFIESNIIGTFNLLEASRIYWESLDNHRKEVFRLHHVSTDEVYGSLGSKGYFSEESCYDPRSPYSASKASSDHLVKSWYHTFGLPTILTNCGNNYGPWQFPEKLIPLAITKAISNQPIPLYGNGLNVRDWIFVDGVVEGVVENIGFRSTLVRRFEKAPVYIPNAKLADNAVVNFSGMTHRRIKWLIGLEYNTSTDQLRLIRNKIEEHISSDSNFASPKEASTFIRIDSFNESSIDLLLYCFTRTTDWGGWLEIKEDLALTVKDIVESSGAGFAFPSRSIYHHYTQNDSPEVFIPPNKV